MEKMTKTELREQWNVEFRETSSLGSEVEVSLPGWRPDCRDTLRVGRVHDSFEVSAPGMGGDFELSYEFLMGGPVKGFGFQSILKKMRGLVGFAFTRHPGSLYPELHERIVASAIDVARRELWG